MKVALMLVLLGVLLCIGNSHEQRVTRVWGNATGQLIKSQRIVVPSGWLKVKTYDFEYEVQTPIRTIRGIKHTEYNKDEVSSDVEITSGGVDANRVELQIKSKRGKRIDSLIEIYG